jgi:hypothetical protein
VIMRAQDYGSEGWGFESLRARQVRGPSVVSIAAGLLPILLPNQF